MGACSLAGRLLAGWPTLGDMRGKIVIKTTGDGGYLELQESQWPGGQGGILFREGYTCEFLEIAANGVKRSVVWRVCLAVHGSILV